jgi:ADP-heptose:LPS heptosyltransferase
MIIALRALGIGDLATGVPALRGLRAAYPDEELALAAPAWLAPLVSLIGGIDRQIDVPDLSWPAPALRPAVAVNLHGRGPQSHRLLLATRPGRLIAFARPPDGPQWRDGEHEVHRWCRMLRWYGIASDPTDLALPRPAANGVPTDATVLHIGAKAVERRWPPDRFAAVARTLTAAGHRVVVTGNAAEREAAATVAASAGLSGTRVLAGTLDLGDLAALIAHARLLISGDTGAGHLATAFGTPSVLLFGPMSPREWGPPPDRPHHRALWSGPRPPGPAGAVHPALAELTPTDVLTAVADLHHPRHPAHPPG